MESSKFEKYFPNINLKFSRKIFSFSSSSILNTFSTNRQRLEIYLQPTFQDFIRRKRNLVLFEENFFFFLKTRMIFFLHLGLLINKLTIEKNSRVISQIYPQMEPSLKYFPNLRKVFRQLNCVGTDANYRAVPIPFNYSLMIHLCL